MSSIATPPPALAQQPATAVLGYGLGDFANSLTLALGVQLLLFYYVDVVGLAPLAVALLLAVVRLWDAVADRQAGRLVGRRAQPGARFRPWIAVAAAPVLLLSLLVFHVPGSGRWLGLVDLGEPSPALAPLYAYVTLGLLGVAYALMNVPYGALAAAMTQSNNERAKLVSARAFGSAFGTVFVAFLIAPQLADAAALAPVRAGVRNPRTGLPFTDGEVTDSFEALARATGRPVSDLPSALAAHTEVLQSVFTLATASFVLVGLLAYTLTWWWCRETATQVPLARAPDRGTLHAAWRTNRALRLLTLALAPALTGLMTAWTMMAFYAAHVLGSLAFFPLLVAVSAVVGLLVTPLLPGLVARLRKRTTFQVSGLLIVLGGVGLWFVPPASPGVPETAVLALTLALGLVALMALGAAMLNAVSFALMADTVEFGEWKTGERAEAASVAVFTLARKVSQGVGAALGGVLLAVGSYLVGPALVDAGGVQPLAASNAIKFAVGPLPALLTVVSMLTFTVYPLSSAVARRIRADNQARKLAAAQAAAEARFGQP